MNSEYVYKTVATKNNLSKTSVERIYKSMWEYIKGEANKAVIDDSEAMNAVFRLNGLGWFYIPKKRSKWIKREIK